MVIENLITQVKNEKPFEIFQEIENYQIKKTPLSSPARNKVIKKYGSNYVSEGKEYGPCIINGNLDYDNCHCSSSELDRQLKIIRNKRELEALERERRESEIRQEKKKMREASERAERRREEEMERIRRERDRNYQGGESEIVVKRV